MKKDCRLGIFAICLFMCLLGVGGIYSYWFLQSTRSIWQENSVEFLELKRSDSRAVAEDQKYHHLLSQKEVLESAANFLMDLETATFQGPLLKLRLSAIDYLVEALAWRENPIHSNVVQTIVHILSDEPPFFINAPIDAKRVFSGDCMELFSALLKYSPEQLPSLLQKTTGTWKEKLFKKAIESFPNQI